ncbi:MAG: methyl-accepting chemotaxis protein [Ectothiorhodospiraceae bacterium]|nr:methyl-accepting chemotaxis protein [Ectothiorhodospiraceae bacterium]
MQLSIRGMLIGLVLAAVGGSIILAATGLLSNARLVAVQDYLLGDVLPQQSASRTMSNVMTEIGERHRALLMADSSGALTSVMPLSGLDQAFTQAGERLATHAADAESERLITAVNDSYAALRAADASLQAMREQDVALGAEMTERVREMDQLIRQVLVNAENMAGRVNLARVREQRSLRQQLEQVGGDPRFLDPQVILGMLDGGLDISRISGEVQTVVALLADLGRRLQLVDNADLLVSLRFNEIAQEINRARQALGSIAGSTDANAEQRALAEELSGVVGQLSGLMVTADNSVYALRERQLALHEEQQTVLAGVSAASAELRGNLQALDEHVVASADQAAVDAQAMANAGRTALVVVTLLVIGLLAVFGFRTMQRVLMPLAQMRTQMQSISGEASQTGDLSMRIHTGRNDEIGHTANAFNQMMETFQEMIRGIVRAAEDLGRSSEALEALSRSSRSVSDKQLSEAEEVAAAVNEMAATVQEVARSTQQAADLAANGMEAADRGSNVVTETTGAIEAVSTAVSRAEEVIGRLKEQSDAVTKVLSVIQAVSEQTNLLALNAAIEAARAGDQGRGFAVVADEVRTLALRTQQSAREIEELVDRLQAGADESVSAMQESRQKAEESVSYAGEAGEALQTINHNVSQITDMNTQIASAAEEQSAVAEKINESITHLNDMARETADTNRQLTDAGNDLTRLAHQLQEMAGRFRV